MTPDAIPFLPRGVRVQFDKVRNADVLLGPERVLMLDQIGVAVLGRLDGNTSVADMALGLAQTYDAPVDVIEPDVMAFVEDLIDRGMVHVRAD